MGKGSLRRPGDEAKYRENWDRIFGEKWCYLRGSDGPLTDGLCKDCYDLIEEVIAEEKINPCGEEGLQPAVWFADSPGAVTEGNPAEGTTVLTVAKLIELAEWLDKQKGIEITHLSTMVDGQRVWYDALSLSDKDIDEIISKCEAAECSNQRGKIMKDGVEVCL